MHAYIQRLDKSRLTVGSNLSLGLIFYVPYTPDSMQALGWERWGVGAGELTGLLKI